MFEFLSGKRVEELDRAAARGFAQVKQDTAVLSRWIKYLHEQNKALKDKVSVQQAMIDAQQVAIRDMKVTLYHMPKTAADIKRFVDSYYDFEPIVRRLKHVEDKITMLELRKPEPAVVHHGPEIRYVEPPKTSTALKDKLMKRLVRNSKEYIKNVVRGLVSKYGRISALQLREMIVDEQGLCSKSSFYRIIEEMEYEKSIAEVNEGKVKVFVPSEF